MTVSSTAGYSGPYLPDGVTTAFPFDFDAGSADEVQVVLDDTVVASGYTVTLNANQATSPGGTITFAAPPTGDELVIVSDPDFTQEIGFANAGPFLAASHDEVADQAARRDIALKRESDRAFKVPIGAVAPTFADMADTFQGIPGGDGSLIGLFTTIAIQAGGTGVEIPADIDLVQTKGYSEVDIGAAVYVYDAAVDAAYVAANPRSSFISTNDRGFRISVEQDINPQMFGAAGDGATDDFLALSAFINSAISGAGIRHVMDALPYATSEPLPAITAPNVWIEGQGAHIHDGGSPQMSGTVIKYIGASAPASKVIDIGPVSGAGNQRLANIKVLGVGVDCNTGLIGYGLSVKSIRHSDIEVVVLNAATRGVDMGVVATLAEDKNIQRCRFNLVLRQTEVAGPCLYLDGDAVANVSMNEFWIDAVHKNAVAIIEANADNNIYRYCRIFKAAGGTATESVSLLGGATADERSRGELFDYFSSNLPIHVYGTGTYAAASSGHYAAIDSENATPDPVIDTGASLHFEKNTSATVEEPFASYTPTVAAGSGTITAVGAVAGAYRKIGKKVEFKAQVPITTNGTGATSLIIGLPVPAAGTVGSIIVGRETALTGKAITGFISTGGSTISCVFYDGTYPGADGRSINVSGFYEVA